MLITPLGTTTKSGPSIFNRREIYNEKSQEKNEDNLGLDKANMYI